MGISIPSIDGYLASSTSNVVRTRHPDYARSAARPSRLEEPRLPLSFNFSRRFSRGHACACAVTYMKTTGGNCHFGMSCRELVAVSWERSRVSSSWRSPRLQDCYRTMLVEMWAGWAYLVEVYQGEDLAEKSVIRLVPAAKRVYMVEIACQLFGAAEENY